MSLARKIKRSEARRLYDGFSKKWRDDARQWGRYGKPGSRKPPFHAWWKMHEKQVEQLRESTPPDVRQYLADGVDPWDPQNLDAAAQAQERGVVEIPMVSEDDGE